MATSAFIGSVGDKRSRKLSMLMPFIGIILADITLLLQAIFFESSPYWFPFSEFVFGSFGGYMGVLSTSFAYITSIPRVKDSEKSKNVARLEGTLGVGSIVGFLISSQLDIINYVNVFVMFIVVHTICFCYIAQMNEPMNSHKDRGDLQVIPSVIMCGRNANFQIILCFIAFGVSYLVFLGSSQILFFYLKQRFYWDAEMYSYLRALTQTCSSIMALFVYPLCKSYGVRDVVLVVIGLVARGLGRVWYAVVWNNVSVFGVVLFEMFARFPASGLRSLISKNSKPDEQGASFATVAVLEGGCKLLSAVVFHTLFPWSISFMPQLSFILMAVLITLPTVLIW
uniref:MFS domain-containing protein n=1 Tax=Angiostrongylus cantonensis TaxID=6313 RepID=A0A0K0DEP7_ANGCA